MYNRYIPQPDGSYRRNRIQEVPSPQEKQVPVMPPPSPPPKDPPPPCSNCIHHSPQRRTMPQPRSKEPGTVTGFLRHLLPKDFDTEDLLVVLLLLLMSGDCRENQNNALLTLALYLFL